MTRRLLRPAIIASFCYEGLRRNRSHHSPTSPSSSNRATDFTLPKTLKQKEMTLPLFVTVWFTAWSARR